MENHLQKLLQDFRTFFEVVITFHIQKASIDNDDQYIIPLKDEAYKGTKMISTIIKNFENIRSDIDKDKKIDDVNTGKH